MTRDHLEANWKELASFARTHCDMLTADEPKTIIGKTLQLTAPSHHRNGNSKRTVEEQCPIPADFVHVPKEH